MQLLIDFLCFYIFFIIIILQTNLSIIFHIIQTQFLRNYLNIKIGFLYIFYDWLAIILRQTFEVICKIINKWCIIVIVAGNRWLIINIFFDYCIFYNHFYNNFNLKIPGIFLLFIKKLVIKNETSTLCMHIFTIDLWIIKNFKFFRSFKIYCLMCILFEFSHKFWYKIHFFFL